MLGTITLTVEQQEPASVTLDEEPSENMGVVHNDTTSTEATKENGHDETPEATPTTPESEEKAKSPDQADGNQMNEVGFKKVFKFVGFKFTVKKDKSEKSDPVQLLTVKKDEVEVNGTDSHEEHTDISADGRKESQQETKDSEQPAENAEKPEQAGESPKEVLEENQKKEEESEVEKKSPESPTNPVVTETSSPFRRFFTQGWAGLRKRTSFKKSKEEDPQEVEKHIKAEEQEKVEAPEVPETVKEENVTETQPAANLSVTHDLSKPSSEESKVSTDENIQNVAEEKPKEEPSPIKEIEMKLECAEVVEKVAPVTENAEKTPEMVSSVSEETPVSDVKSEVDMLKDNAESQITDGIAVASSSTAAEGISEDLQGTTDSGDVDNDQPQLASSTESGEQEKSQEAITTEAELLSSQEKAKIQGSPLKKLFSSSGLRKLSGKKSKSRKEDDSKVEVATEAVSSESPEAIEIDGGDSSPSSPDESATTSPTEKPSDDPQEAAEAEGEGTTSDGERKKDGITPWASFKKLVTPKRRPKRPSESDKEDEFEKAKTSTMSSTESAGVENVEESKEINEEQKLEKSTEESKKKVDSSVSWEALICVGSSKKRARKTSDSDEDEGIKSPDEAKKTEEVVPAKDIDSDSPITSSQEQNQESTSPDQAGSPTEADGASTWQSFKRLVTPRRKSRTRVEEKNDETAGNNAEQSTSEGEAGKEETWVSFKKLIPGRKKKKSDGKQEHAATTETGQPLSEAAEDDSDEPAVVPLAEFDAAEQEKLDAQKSLKEALPTVLREQERSLERSSKELIHAVTVTVIEGERAITNLEERSPSWISATVSETIEHAKEIEEAADIIKTEVTIEETVVLRAVSQVMTETPNTIINEMELTSEALTALEEAIENSCAEETTEMISAVSQLGGSVVSTGEATPIPDEDASVKTLEDQKKHTENVLNEVAEKAKLSLDTLQTSQDMTAFEAPMDTQEIICQSAPLCVEEETNLSPVSLEEQGDKSTIICVEATVHQIEVQKDINAIIDPLDQAVNICVGPLISKDEQSDQSTDAIQIQPKGFIPVITEMQPQEVVPVVSEEQPQEVIPVVREEQPQEVVPVVSEEQPQKIVPVASEKQPQEVVPVVSEEQPQEVVPVVREEQPQEVVPVVSEEQPQEIVPAVSEEKPEEVVPVVREEQPQEVVPVVSEEQPQEIVPVASEKQPQEVVPVVSEEQPQEVAPVVSEEQPQEVAPVVSEEQPQEVAPVVSEELPQEIAPAVSEVQPEEVVPAVSEKQPEEVTAVSEGQPEEAVPVVSEVQNEEVVLVASQVESEEVVPVASKVQLEQAVPLASELQSDKAISVSSKLQSVQIAYVSSELQPEELVPVSSELPTEELVLGSSKIQAEEVVPLSRELQAEVIVSLASELQCKEIILISSEMQPEEALPVSSELKFDETLPVSNHLQSEEVILAPIELEPEEVVLSVVQSEEAVIVSNKVQSMEVIPKSNVQFEEVVSVSNELQPEKTVPLSNEVGAEDVLSTSIEVQPEEIASVSNEVKPEERVSVTNEVLAEVEVSASNELKSEFGSVSTELNNVEVQNIERIPVCHDIVDESDVTSASEEVKAKEGICVAEMDKEFSPAVSVEAQSEEGLGVQIEEPVEENVSLSDTIKAEVQAEDSVTVSDELPVEVCAIAFAEAKVEECTPESAEVETEESDVVSDEIQVEAYAFVLPGAKIEESTSESIKVQNEDSAQILSNVQLAESSLGQADVQAEGIVQKLEEFQPVEISPVLPVNKIVQVDECISLLHDKQSEMASHVAIKVQADQTAPATIEQINYVKSQVSEVQSDITPSLLIQDDAKASTAVTEEQKKHTQEQIVEIKEEIVTTDIPELESSEAIKTSEPVTAAAVEEQVLTEIVKTIDIPKDRVEPSEVADDDKRFEESETLSRGLQVVAESVSQKAAAIVDAAIEAATNCFVVDATGQGDKFEEMTVSEKDIQIITIESCSTTIVHNIVETTVETVVTNSVQEQNLENELNSQLLQTVPVHEPIKLCPQLEESEQGKAEGEQKPGKEIELVVSLDAPETNEISTQTSDAQEKAPTVES
ncbi:A-kinase anchor protein 12 isoform X2 [Ranitomeya imitator]|uniref:A-kinase anchor protein 12 isoform X2 n=1 Tax=Ranitomeya imitator TaxID=111125 RepID=UPI0037E84EAF